MQLSFPYTEGTATGRLSPTGNVHHRIDGIDVTCLDNGMPVSVVTPDSVGLSCYESYEDLLSAGDPIARVDSYAAKQVR